MPDLRFLDALDNEVSGLAKKFNLKESKAFLVWLGKLAFDLDDDEGYESVIVDGPNDKSIDLFWVDDFANRVIVAQGTYSKSADRKLKDNAVEALLGSLDWLNQPETLEQEGKPELAQAARAYLEAMEKEYSTELWFVYCGPKNENIDQRIRVYNANPENQQRRRSCRHCDLDLLDSLFLEYRGEGRRVEVATFEIEPNPIQVAGGYGRGLVSTIKGKELVSLYSKFGDELFARNVRLWLGAKKGSVNAGILETLADGTERGNFWAYNNGVTMICDSFQYAEDSERLSLRNFSIVNGCQTTVTLSQKPDLVTDDVAVLLRVIGPPEQTIDSIIRFTNSQNQIRVWDISTQDQTQRRLQRDFENLEKPVYYQLRRGEQSALDASQRKKFRANGKMRTIRHDVLAQYLAAYKVDPVTAYKDKALLFTKYYQDVFPVDLRAVEGLFVWKAGEAVQQAVRNEMVLDVEKGDKRGSLILKSGGRVFAVGVFSQVAELRNGPDYLRTITEERTTSRGADDRIRKYAELSTLWYKQAVTSLMARSDRSLSVLVRDQDFFEDVKKEIEFLYRTMAFDNSWLKNALPALS
jgi:hypothetical protein